jgi:hypothetical protein
MTVPTPRRADSTDEDTPRAFETLDGDVVLYDSSNPDAWIQSSLAVDIEATTGVDPA